MPRLNPLIAMLFVAAVVLGQLTAGPAHTLSDQQTRRIDQLIADLRADHHRFNAHQAMDQLLGVGRPAIPALQKALRSEDHQQRHMAADVLISLGHGWRDDPVQVQPTLAMLDVLIEGLRHDNLPRGYDRDEMRYSYTFNARYGTEYLTRHIALAEPLLVKALHSDDGQQQFLAACLLGWAGRSQHVDTLAPILLAHLRDNTLASDGLLAAPALYRLGSTVIPHLEKARLSADAQQDKFIDLILLDLRDPPTTGAKLKHRHRTYQLADFCYDPVYQFDLTALHRYPFTWPNGMPRIDLPTH